MDYPEDNPFFFNTGKMKDEACGILITEFVVLRCKMSSYMKDNGRGGKSAKGLRRISKEIKHKEVLMNNKQMLPKLKKIRSQNHEVGCCEISKISLSCFDDKRYYFGHFYFKLFDVLLVLTLRGITLG